MNTPERDDAGDASFASPPCFMHELSEYEESAASDPQTWIDVKRWRKAERQRLTEARLAISADGRTAMTVKMLEGLDAAIGDVRDRLVSVYWPFRGEPDLRPWMNAVIERGGHIALPVVVEKAQPLVFRAWRPGDRLERGVWNIPVPAEGPAVQPEVVLAPLVGFDPDRYRLGHGGGYFDRTLAAMPTKPYIVGIGYAMSRLATIFPQPHDIPMDVIVTEEGVAPAYG